MHEIIEALNKRSWIAKVLDKELEVKSPSIDIGYPLLCKYRDIIKNAKDNKTDYDDDIMSLNVECVEACTVLTKVEAEHLLKIAKAECIDLLAKVRIALGISTEKNEEDNERFLSQEQ